MSNEEWVVILNALDKYMKCYDIIQGKKENYWRDKKAIENLMHFLNGGLGENIYNDIKRSNIG